jgi:3-oxoadipyl-CoA thiolase
MNEVWICDGVRTPFGRYGGALSGIRCDDLAALPLASLLARNPGLDPHALEEVILGCANQAGEDNRNVARMGLLLAGFPQEVPAATINRLCGSGIDAVGTVARAIASGEIALGIGGGVESMSRAPFVMPKADAAFSRSNAVYDTTIGWRFVNPAMKARYGVDQMPETAENVAADLAISREDQDAFAMRSQQRCASAQAAGFFAREILPMSIPARKGDAVLFERDEHPRADTTLASLSRLKPVVRAGGSVTAGNASGVNDGAAALLLASTAAVKTHSLSPRARVVAMTTAGLAPRVMGLGPVPATKKLLARTGLELPDIDWIELNEAFAAQALGCCRQLGLADDAPQVNPNGGAIALGHPLGASGARLVLTAVNQLESTATRRAVATMCIGVGQGIAMLIERA